MIELNEGMSPDELRAARATLGLTQSEMADKLHVHERTYREWELTLGASPVVATVIMLMLDTKRNEQTP